MRHHHTGKYSPGHYSSRRKNQSMTYTKLPTEVEVTDDLGSDWYELDCFGCGKEGLDVEIGQEDGYNNAKAAAITHVKETGHTVSFTRIEHYKAQPKT